MAGIKEKLLKKSYHKQQTAFVYYFRKTLKRGRREDLHQLRVAIKRLRATWELSELLSGGVFVKKFHRKYFSSLFKKAGELREAQINLQLIKTVDNPAVKVYASYLKKTKRKAKQSLMKKMKAFKMKKIERLDESLLSGLKNLRGQVIEERAITFVQQQLDIVASLREELPNEERLHDIRIHLKKVHEVLSLINKFDDYFVLQALQQKTKLINEEVGDWHDYVVLLESMGRFVRQKGRRKYLIGIKRFIRPVQQEQKRREQQIIAALDVYIYTHGLSLMV